MKKQEQATLTELFHRLYGHDGFEGDIPGIKKALTQVPKNTEHIAIIDTAVFGKTGNNGIVGQVKELTKRQWRIWVTMGILASASGGIGAGLTRWLA